MLTPDVIDHLVFMATCAPSVHNSQPWRFDVDGDVLWLRTDHARQLTALDPDSRELVMSCGAALHHLQVAARGRGLTTRVELLPANASPEAVARIGITSGPEASPAEVDLATAILLRHTHRGRFDDVPVAGALLDELRLAVEQQHAMLRVVQADELVSVEVLVSRAEERLQQSPAYLRELSAWVWQADEDAERTDGMTPNAVEHGTDRAESLQGRAFDGLPLPRPSEPPAAEHPAVVLLTTEGDGALQWIQAGQAMSALLLTATQLHLLVQPIGQVVDVPTDRWALWQLLGTVGAPQMLLRLGFGMSSAESPRRAVSDVIGHR